MEALRTKRIRAGVIVIVVSVIAMAVLASLSHQPYGSQSWSERYIIGWGTRTWTIGGQSGQVYTHFLRIKHILALGLIGVGIGAVLVIVGLTTPRDRMAGETVEELRSKIPRRPRDTEG